MLHKLCNAVCKVRIKMKTSQLFWCAENPFSINNEPISQGKIALKFPNFQIQNLLITLDWRLLDAFWCHFWTLSIFHVFEAKVIVFWYYFFWKIAKFLRGGYAFSVKKFSSRFPRGKSRLNFLYLKILNLLITP